LGITIRSFHYLKLDGSASPEPGQQHPSQITSIKICRKYTEIGTKILLDNLIADDYSINRGIDRMIDGFDKAILNILQKDGRTSNADIARQVSLAPSAVLERIRKLEERGVIRGYSADLDAKAMGYGLSAIIAVRTSECGEGVGELLSEIPEVQEVYEVAGDDCFYIKVVSSDAESLGLFLREKIKGIKNVTNTRTTVVLKTFKQGTLVPIEEEELKRARGK
jgi:Lrp/AsnC family transcriptional regulator, leucine-responsive regulatory protein